MARISLYDVVIVASQPLSSLPSSLFSLPFFSLFLFFSFLFFSLFFPSLLYSILSQRGEPRPYYGWRPFVTGRKSTRVEGLSCHKFHAEPRAPGVSAPSSDATVFALTPFFPQTTAKDARHALISASLSGPSRARNSPFFARVSRVDAIYRAI